VNGFAALNAAPARERIDMRRGGCNAAGGTESLLLVRLRYEESGADMIEYALIATLIALAAVAAIQGVGTKIASYYSSIASSM
jgi:pilus assembly protein Flp/PilA